MTTSPSRKSPMTLYCSPRCAYGHGVRFVLSEKAIAADIEYLQGDATPRDLLEANPLGNTPTLVDRDLVLSDSRIIMEYLDERFPHPPLQAMDPVARARARMTVRRIDQDWFGYLDQIDQSPDPRKKSKAAKQLQKELIGASPVFDAKPYFLSDDFSLVDCALAPLLWRLGALGIDLPTQAEPIRSYANRLFRRPAFKASLSAREREYPTLAEASA
ncbi:glutathione S-transferase N-terminal domain-containing protein [Methylomagnum ishizawai]|uniref:glutathione S-transferase N-terminal domain-containing protein n=1 Tax=Methylomagnum ishizawai TaxID=1760988 RepID=UPI001FE93810|nr:glutathione S-transferase N-terminal domain-containing protein [Methylomagnum ishizawai]